jgi:7-cyano-7-deazaguanine synthase in queuosine biosynthesis
MTSPTKILWTGGWDSTFRLLQLVIEYKVPVQPIYLIDFNRKSFPLEIAVIQKIKDALGEEHPYTRKLIRPTKLYLIDDLQSNRDVEANFKKLLGQQYLGVQYKHFANLVRNEKITAMELSIHRDDRAHMFLDGYVKEIHSAIGTVTKLDQKRSPAPLNIFRSLTFPLFNLTKTEMHKRAIELGFDTYMHMTWFCYNPVGGEMIPCGRCNPCKYTKSEDMAWRVPRFPYILLIRRKAQRFARRLSDAAPIVIKRISKLSK